MRAFLSILTFSLAICVSSSLTGCGSKKKDAGNNGLVAAGIKLQRQESTIAPPVPSSVLNLGSLKVKLSKHVEKGIDELDELVASCKMLKTGEFKSVRAKMIAIKENVMREVDSVVAGKKELLKMAEEGKVKIVRRFQGGLNALDAMEKRRKVVEMDLTEKLATLKRGLGDIVFGEEKKQDAKEQKINEMYSKEIASVSKLEKSSDEIINLLYAQHVKEMEKMKAVYLAVLEKISRVTDSIEEIVSTFFSGYGTNRMNLAALQGKRDKVVRKIPNVGELKFELSEEKDLIDDEMVEHYLEKVRKEALRNFDQIFNKMVNQRIEEVLNEASKFYEETIKSLTGYRSSEYYERLRLNGIGDYASSQIEKFIGSEDQNRLDEALGKLKRLKAIFDKKMNDVFAITTKIEELRREENRNMKRLQKYSTEFPEITNLLKTSISYITTRNIERLKQQENRPGWNILLH